jgi:hypothetical protein
MTHAAINLSEGLTTLAFDRLLGFRRDGWHFLYPFFLMWCIFSSVIVKNGTKDNEERGWNNRAGNYLERDTVEINRTSLYLGHFTVFADFNWVTIYFLPICSCFGAGVF